MKKYLLPYFCLVSSFIIAQSWPEELIITPERTNFVKTSTYSEVMTFLKEVSSRSANTHLFSMGKSPEGKEIPVLCLADPKISSAEEAKASGKLIVYIQGNIHAGEVEGKEALLMLTREILLGKKSHLLSNQIILFAPIYNTDSNDKMEKGRRPSQEDSPLEVGIRENSQGLDLNRDGVKMETPETNGLITSVIAQWDPKVFVDLHTTNGTWHGYSLTWAPSYHSAGEREPYDFTMKMLNEITEKVQKENGLHFGPFGDFDVREGWPLKNFYTYNHHPRYLVNQFGLRNRVAILSEAFAHERFYQRINSTHTFVNNILEYTNDHAKEIQSITASAEQKTIQNVLNNAGRVKKGVRYKMVVGDTLNNFRTYDYVSYTKDGKQQFSRTGKIISVDSVKYFATFESVVEATLPRGYLIPSEFKSVVELLKKHGVKVEMLSKSKSFDGETFVIDSVEHSKRKFEGHFMATARGKFVSEKKNFKKGDYTIDLAQPLANFIFYLLEPQSDDGLVNWNFFDDHFIKQKTQNKTISYPVFKYYK